MKKLINFTFFWKFQNVVKNTENYDTFETDVKDNNCKLEMLWLKVIFFVFFSNMCKTWGRTRMRIGIVLIPIRIRIRIRIGINIEIRIRINIKTIPIPNTALTKLLLFLLVRRVLNQHQVDKVLFINTALATIATFCIRRPPACEIKGRRTWKKDLRGLYCPLLVICMYNSPSLD